MSSHKLFHKKGLARRGGRAFTRPNVSRWHISSYVHTMRGRGGFLSAGPGNDLGRPSFLLCSRSSYSAHDFVIRHSLWCQMTPTVRRLRMCPLCPFRRKSSPPRVRGMAIRSFLQTTNDPGSTRSSLGQGHTHPWVGRTRSSVTVGSPMAGLSPRGRGGSSPRRRHPRSFIALCSTIRQEGRP